LFFYSAIGSFHHSHLYCDYILFLRLLFFCFFIKYPLSLLPPKKGIDEIGAVDVTAAWLAANWRANLQDFIMNQPLSIALSFFILWSVYRMQVISAAMVARISALEGITTEEALRSSKRAGGGKQGPVRGQSGASKRPVQGPTPLEESPSRSTQSRLGKMLKSMKPGSKGDKYRESKAWPQSVGFFCAAF
jgi:hypothetical protein